jgi:hypothetical protein
VVAAARRLSEFSGAREAGIGLLGVLLLAACASMSQPTIARDRYDYVTTISNRGNGRPCSTCLRSGTPMRRRSWILRR